MHNRLRRDLAAAVAMNAPQTELDVAWAQKLFVRCLNALGGPVETERPPIDVTVLEGEVMVTAELVDMAVLLDDAPGLGDTPHPPTEAEAADIGRPLDDVDHDLIRLGSDGH